MRCARLHSVRQELPGGGLLLRLHLGVDALAVPVAAISASSVAAVVASIDQTSGLYLFFVCEQVLDRRDLLAGVNLNQICAVLRSRDNRDVVFEVLQQHWILAAESPTLIAEVDVNGQVLRFEQHVVLRGS